MAKSRQARSLRNKSRRLHPTSAVLLLIASGGAPVLSFLCLQNGQLHRCLRKPSRKRCQFSCDHEDELSKGGVVEGRSTTRRAFLVWSNFAALTTSHFRHSAIAVDDVKNAPATWIGSTRSTSPIPYSSTRRYRPVRLQNGLQVLLVSDKRAFRASAALSVGGAGQFADPKDIPGLAHLMEHMILSFDSRSRLKESSDFELWLGEREGASNAFTAYATACFHFSCPEDVFAEALVRFSGLFLEQDVERVCRKTDVIQREILRVDSELDFTDAAIQAYYLTKDFVNIEHPYSRFHAGNLDSLENKPLSNGIDIGERLVDFFKAHYQPSNAVLVAVSQQELNVLERWVNVFSNALSRISKPLNVVRQYPGGFLQGNRLKHMVLYTKDEELYETVSFQWCIDLEYTAGQSATSTQIAFIMSQIVSRRGPGSLYYFLQRRGWVPQGNTGIPRVSVPVDVSNFQIIQLSLNLTPDGYFSRLAVVTAVYDTVGTLKVNGISRELISQCATIAKLYGYVLAPRPPDAVELAIDAQSSSPKDLASGDWLLFPPSSDRAAINALRQSFSSFVSVLSDPGAAVIIATVRRQTLAKSRRSLKGEPLPTGIDVAWLTEPTTGAKFFFEDMVRLSSTRLEEVLLTRIVSNQELVAPMINPLVPGVLRPARSTAQASQVFCASETILVRSAFQTGVQYSSFHLLTNTPQQASDWIMLEPGPFDRGLPLPLGPPEPSCRCAYVLELLSSRPARADIRQAARAELWKISFEYAVADLAELGAPGGLAYDLSFNKFGLRIAAVGISQNLPSYFRRLCRRLIQHHLTLLDGPEIFPDYITRVATAEANRAPNLSSQRKRRLVSSLRRSTTNEAAVEGVALLRSCSGAACFGQGDLTRMEAEGLLSDLQLLFNGIMRINPNSIVAIPEISDLNYRPNWKPRAASPCLLPGAAIISNACGRVPR